MKHYLRNLTFGAALAACALPALPQQGVLAANENATTAITQDDAAQQARVDLYNKFTQLFSKDKKAAYEVGKEFIQKYPTPDDDYLKYIKKFVAAYERQERRNEFYTKLNASDYNAGIVIGKQILVDNPDDLETIYDVARAGLYAAQGGNDTNNASTAFYARKALEQFKAGKTLKANATSQEKDKALGEVYYALAVSETNPTEKAKNFIEASKTQAYTKDPALYYFLSLVYKDDYAKLSDEFGKQFTTDEQKASPEALAASKKINESADRFIDALARAVYYANLTPTDQRSVSVKTAALEPLTALYKYRNKNSDIGMQGFINASATRPIPQPDQPLDLFPSATPGDATTGGATASPTPATAAPAATMRSNAAANGGATTRPAATTGGATARPATATTPNARPSTPATPAKPVKKPRK